MNDTANRLLEPYFGYGRMRELFCDRGRVAGMLEFEAALARAQARVGLVPAEAAEVIGRHCQAQEMDLDALAQAIVLAGNTAIPLVKMLGRQIAAESPEAERYLHLGATSQDAMDTGLVLQLRRAVDLLEQQLAELGEQLSAQARRHASTVMPGRTWLQHATPVTLGMKLASVLGSVSRHRLRLQEMRHRLLSLQFGGASGTLAALGEQAWPVAEALAAELQLSLPEQPWHTQRDRLAELAGWLGSLAGTLGKLGRDLSLLMQTEAGEVFEPAAPGKGGSSTMPHKRNPVGAAVLIHAGTRAPGLVATLLSAMPQEHERSLGLWHAEWDSLPELCCLVSGAIDQASQLAAGLEVDTARMLRNLEQTRGLILAEPVSVELARHLGRQDAHHLLEQCCRRAVEQDRHLGEVLHAELRVTEHLSGDLIDRLLDPANYTGQAARWVEQACREHEQLQRDMHNG